MPIIKKAMLSYWENKDIFLIDEKRRFCVVADGLGGATAGELASRIFLKTAVQVFQPADDSANH
jgi:protein phosphatase